MHPGADDADMAAPKHRPATEPLGYQPLYKRVKALLVARIADGRWQAGQLIPNEFQIADEMEVSQGTVRKALHEMTADNLLVRKQGRGTFVASYDEERVLFQFFRLTPDAGMREFPDSTVLSLEDGACSLAERAALRLEQGKRVWRLLRRRTLGETPVVIERIVLPAAIFPDLDRLGEIPNNVYGLYSSRYGVTVARTVEKLKAVGADSAEARHLDCAFATPLLEIDRCAFGLDGRAVEWRVSRCLTTDHHYLSDLR
jgi:GntR family transcriptional regulator